MKTPKSIVYLTFCIFLTACTTKSIILSYTTPSSDILYCGIPQRITFQTEIKYYDVKTDNGSIEKISEKEYLITPDTIPGKLLLTFNKKEVSEEISFRVKSIPTLGFQALTDSAILNSGQTSAQNFQTLRCFQLYMKNFDINFSAEIVSYTITRYNAHGMKESFVITTPQKYPNESNSIAQQSQPGDIILIENIMIRITSSHPSCKSFLQTLPGQIYYLK